ncbi:DUF6600 domain-containing protein [Labilithrix luteola]|nr:DUF6600 domain-containing protein [Labilithrix luteola]
MPSPSSLGGLAVVVSFGLASFGSVLALGCAENTPEARMPEAAHGESELEEPIGISTTRPVRSAPPEFDDADPSAVRLFFDVLAPFGTWSEDPRFGLVWAPSHESIGETFVPYATHGRWTHRALAVAISPSEPDARVDVNDYVWVSELPWGWVTFHYGRWTYADHGWAWIPGRRYAGAWVDWRSPTGREGRQGVVGWGPTPPSHLWQVIPGPRSSRAPAGTVEVRDAQLAAVPFAAFATPYAYVQARDLFAADLGARLLYGNAALAVAHTTQPTAPPSPAFLGFRPDEVPAVPVMDRGLQQAWMLATPASATAVGAGPELSAPRRLRSFVASSPRFTAASAMR